MKSNAILPNEFQLPNRPIGIRRRAEYMYLNCSLFHCFVKDGDPEFSSIPMNELTENSTDPTIVARATTYSGKVVRIVHVFSDEAFAVYAEHYSTRKNFSHINVNSIKT